MARVAQKAPLKKEAGDADDSDSPQGKRRGRGADFPPIVTEELLAEFEARAVEWRHNPEKFEDWSLERSQVHLQILDHMATHPPPGRSSGMLIITAIKDVRDQVHTLVEVLIEERNKRAQRGHKGGR